MIVPGTSSTVVIRLSTQKHGMSSQETRIDRNRQRTSQGSFHKNPRPGPILFTEISFVSERILMALQDLQASVLREELRDGRGTPELHVAGASDGRIGPTKDLPPH